MGASPNFFSFDGRTPGIFANTTANRPATAITGTLFVSTDDLLLQRYQGGAWETIGGGGSAFVPLTRQLTIAGTTQDLSADRTWNVSFASLTAKPTTIAGYGITDAVATSRQLTIAGTTHDLSADRTWNVSFASLTAKPTTIAGYGITDGIVNSLAGQAGAIYIVSTNDAVLLQSSYGNRFTCNNNGSNRQQFTITGTGLLKLSTIEGAINQSGAGSFYGHSIELTTTAIGSGTNYLAYYQLDSAIKWGIQTSGQIRSDQLITGSSGTATGLVINGTVNQSGTAGYEIISMSITETATGGSPGYLMRFQVGGVERLRLNRAGSLVLAGSLTATGITSNSTLAASSLSVGTFIETGSPGSGAGQWRLGTFRAGAVALDTANYVEVSIGGIVRKLLVST